MKLIQTTSGKIEIGEVLQGLAELNLSDLERFAKQFTKLLEKKKFPEISQREQKLIDQIKNGGPSEGFYKKYDPLSLKCAQGIMTEDENKVYLELIKVSEKWAVERLKFMVELADIWGVSLDDVLKRLDIQPREPVYA